MADSKPKRTGRPKKGSRGLTHPYIAKHPDCPLSFHPGSGQFYKVWRKRRYYFGSEPVDAVKRYASEWSYIVRGEEVPGRDGATVGWLVNMWLSDRRKDVDAGRLKLSTWDQYREVGVLIVTQAGRETPVSAMTPGRFTDLHRLIEDRHGQSPAVMRRVVTIARMPWRWGYKSGLAKEVQTGPRFKPLGKSAERARRFERGRQTFTAGEIKTMLDDARPFMRAAILLGINGGYTQAEVADLRRDWIDLKAGVIDQVRAKTKFARRVTLWPETVAAIKAMPRYKPKAEARGLLFVARTGEPYTEGRGIMQAFARLMQKHKIELQQAGFGKLRASFRTVADVSADTNAIRLIMGHQLGQGVEESYIRSIGDDRLKAVTDGVRAWLWPADKDKT